MDRIKINIMSSQFCPGRNIPKQNTTFGGYFLSITIVTFSIYFLGGILINFFYFNKVQLPHSDFWYNLYSNTILFISFLFHKRIIDNQTDDHYEQL